MPRQRQSATEDEVSTPKPRTVRKRIPLNSETTKTTKKTKYEDEDFSGEDSDKENRPTKRQRTGDEPISKAVATSSSTAKAHEGKFPQQQLNTKQVIKIPFDDLEQKHSAAMQKFQQQLTSLQEAHQAQVAAYETTLRELQDKNKHLLEEYFKVTAPSTEDHERTILELKKEIARLKIMTCEAEKREQEISRQNVQFERKYSLLKEQHQALEKKFEQQQQALTQLQQQKAAPSPVKAPALSAEEPKTPQKPSTEPQPPKTPTHETHSKEQPMEEEEPQEQEGDQVQEAESEEENTEKLRDNLNLYLILSGVNIVKSSDVPQPEGQADPFYEVCFLCDYINQRYGYRFMVGAAENEEEVEIRPVSYLPFDVHDRIYAEGAAFPPAGTDNGLSVLPESLRQTTIISELSTPVFFAKMVLVLEKS